MKFWIRNFSLSLMSLLLATCRTAPNKSTEIKESVRPLQSGLGLNDVSILIPVIAVKEFKSIIPTLSNEKDSGRYVLDGLGAELSRIHTSELTTRAKVRPFDLPTQPPPRLDLDLSTFRLVALRFDPCANIRTFAGNDDNCLRQLRLVWQRFAAPVGPPGVKMDPMPADANIHAIYQLSRAEFTEVVATLRSLHQKASVDTSTMPLLPHPVLAAEGVDSPYYKGIMGLVERYARSEKLTNVAHLSSVVNGATWQMVLLAVQNGKYVQEDVSEIEPPQKELSSSVQFMRRNGGNPDLEVMPLGKTKFFLVEPFDQSLSPAERQAAEDSKHQRVIANIQAIENPRIHDAKNLDCSSCHRALSVYARAEEKEKSNGRELPRSPNMYASKWDLSFKVDPLLLDFSGPWTLQMFSYFGNVAKITPRVINETAEVLDYIDANY